jgi:hypothetical protein
VLVYDGDVPDPFLLYTGGRWYAYATQSGGRNVQVLTSPDLLHWELVGEGLPELPRWSRPGFTWSPAVLARGDGFVMYVAVREARYERQAIAVAESPRPEGPFRPVPAGPLVFQASRGGSIDPDPFVGADGSVTLVWKSDGELVGQPATLWARPLTEDGLRLRGWRRRLLRTDAAWEQPLIEAPCLWRPAADRWLLFYSAGRWMTDSYGIGYAWTSRPGGRFRKVTVDGPWLGSDSQMAGPGGQCLVQDAAGDTYIAYHAWAPDRIGYAQGGARMLHIDRLGLDGAGRPVRMQL